MNHPFCYININFTVMGDKCTKLVYTDANGDMQKVTDIKQQKSRTMILLTQHLANVTVPIVKRSSFLRICPQNFQLSWIIMNKPKKELEQHVGNSKTFLVPRKISISCQMWPTKLKWYERKYIKFPLSSSPWGQYRLIQWARRARAHGPQASGGPKTADALIFSSREICVTNCVLFTG